MTSVQVTAGAAVVLVLMGGLALWYNSDSEKQSREMRRDLHSMARGRAYLDSAFEASQQFRKTRETDVLVVTDSMSLAHCARKGRLVAYRADTLEPDSASMRRLRETASQRGSSALLIRVRSRDSLVAQGYLCP